MRKRRGKIFPLGSPLFVMFKHNRTPKFVTSSLILVALWKTKNCHRIHPLQLSMSYWNIHDWKYTLIFNCSLTNTKYLLMRVKYHGQLLICSTLCEAMSTRILHFLHNTFNECNCFSTVFNTQRLHNSMWSLWYLNFYRNPRAMTGFSCDTNVNVSNEYRWLCPRLCYSLTSGTALNLNLSIRI